MTARKYILAADIQTTAPLHITAIEGGAYNPTQQRITRFESKAPGMIGCALTRTLRIQSAAYAAESGAWVIPEVAVIPASTVAGKLRRAACDLIFESIVKRGLHVTADAYNTMTTGMARAELKAGSATADVVRTARLDPFLGLFGGTSFALAAGSVISEGWPLLEVTKPMLMTEPIGDGQAMKNIGEMTEAVAIIKRTTWLICAGSIWKVLLVLSV